MAYKMIAGETGEYTGKILSVLTTAITQVQYILYWESNGDVIKTGTVLQSDLTQDVSDVTFPVLISAGDIDDHQKGDVGLSIDVTYVAVDADGNAKVERNKGKFLNVIPFTDE